MTDYSIKILEYKGEYFIRSTEAYTLIGKNWNGKPAIIGTDDTKYGLYMSKFKNDCDSGYKKQRWYIWLSMDSKNKFMLENKSYRKVMGYGDGKIPNKTPGGPRLYLDDGINSETFGYSLSTAPKETNLDSHNFYKIGIISSDMYDNRIKAFGDENNCVKGIQVEDKTVYLEIISNDETGFWCVDKNGYITNFPCDYKNYTSSLLNKVNNTLVQVKAKIKLTTPNSLSYYIFTRSKNSYYIQEGDYVFDVKGASKDSGTLVQLYEKNGTVAQKWYIWKDQFGRLIFESATGNHLLDIHDGHKDNPGNLYVRGSMTEEIHQNRVFTVIDVDSKNFVYKITYPYDNKKKDRSVGGKSNGKEQPLVYDNGNHKIQFIDTKSNKAVSFDSIEFYTEKDILGTKNIFDQYSNVCSSSSVYYSEKDYDGDLKTPETNVFIDDDKLNIEFEKDQSKLANTIKSKFFETIDTAISSTGTSSTFNFHTYENMINPVLLSYNIGPTTDTNYLNLKNFEFSYNTDKNNKPLFNWAKLMSRTLGITENHSIKNLVEIFSYFGFLSADQDFIMRLKQGSEFPEFISLITKDKDILPIERLGWSRYMPQDKQTINEHLSYFNEAFSKFVQRVLERNLYNEDYGKDELKTLFENMFIKKNDNGKYYVFDYVLYTGLISQILKFYEKDFLKCVPTMDLSNDNGKTYCLPYWNSSQQFFNSDVKTNKTPTIIGWSIVNVNDGGNDKPIGIDDLSKNEIKLEFHPAVKTSNDYNNVFHVFNRTTNCTHNIADGNMSISNVNDVSSSYNILWDTKGCITSDIANIDFNPVPKYIAAEINDNYKKAIVTDKDNNMIKEFNIGTRYKGCYVSRDVKTYRMYIYVSDYEYLTNGQGDHKNSMQLVVCGDDKLDSSGKDCYRGDPKPLTSYYPVPTKINILIVDEDNKVVEDIKNVGQDYQLTINQIYGGVDGDCYNNGRSKTNNKPGWDSFVGDGFDRSHLETVQIKCDMSWLKNATTISGDKNVYTFTEGTSTWLGKSTNWSNLDTTLIQQGDKRISNGKVCGRGVTNYSAHYQDAGWIRDDEIDYKNWLPTLLQKSYFEGDLKYNATIKSKYGQRKLMCGDTDCYYYYGEAIELQVQLGAENAYKGNVIDNECVDSIDQIDTKKYGSNSNDMLARCLVTCDNKTIRVFDSRVDNHIIKIIQKYSTDLSKALEESVLNYFVDKPIQVLPLRVMHDYIPYHMSDGNKSINSIENAFGPIMINVPNPVLTKYKNYIGTNTINNKNLKTIDLNLNKNLIQKAIASIGVITDVKSTFLLDNISADINKYMSDVPDLSIKGILISLHPEFNNIDKFISLGNNNNLYTIKVVDLTNLDSNNEFTLTYNLNKKKTWVHLLITDKELTAINENYNSINIHQLSVTSLPVIKGGTKAYDSGYNLITTGDKSTVESYIKEEYLSQENVNTEIFFNNYFSYGIKDFYLYGTSLTNTTNSSVSSDVVGGESSKSLNIKETTGVLGDDTSAQAYVVNVQLGVNKQSLPGWLTPYWIPPRIEQKNDE